MFCPTGAEQHTSVLVAEIGYYKSTAGYAGWESPRELWPSLIGTRADGHPVFPVSMARPYPDLEIRSPYDSGRFSDDLGLEIITRMVQGGSSGGETPDGDVNSYRRADQWISCGLRDTLAGGNVLLVEPTLLRLEDKIRLAETMFQKGNVEALYLAKQATLAAIAASKVTALIINAGHAFTTAVSVVDGIQDTGGQATGQAPGGRHLDEWAMQLLRAFDPSRDIPLYSEVIMNSERMSKTTPTFRNYAMHSVARHFKENVAEVASSDQDISLAKTPIVASGASSTPGSDTFMLPDKSCVEVMPFAHRLAEMLFDTSIGPEWQEPYTRHTILETLYAAYLRSETEYRKDLAGNVLVTGGSSLIRGLEDRIDLELSRIHSPSNPTSSSSKFRRISYQYIDKARAAWVGGSILGSLTSSLRMFVRRAEWEEHGPRALTRKCI